MKVIFLDIDGVLNITSSELFKKEGTKNSYFHFSPVPVENLNNLIMETGAVIVVSSSWRYGRTCLESEWLLNNRGVRCKVVGHTPTTLCKNGENYSSQPRGEEIKAWLGQFGRRVERFVIIDDDLEIAPEHIPYFVITNSMTGFNSEAYFKALKILKESNHTSSRSEFVSETERVFHNHKHRNGEGA